MWLAVHLVSDPPLIHHSNRYSNRSEPWIVDRSDAFAWQFRVSEFEDQDEAEEYLSQVRVPRFPAFLCFHFHPHHN